MNRFCKIKCDINEVKQIINSNINKRPLKCNPENYVVHFSHSFYVKHIHKVLRKVQNYSCFREFSRIL